VYLARNPVTREKVALKQIINAFTSLTDARRIFREIKVMKHFAHPHIVKLLHVVRPANVKDFEHIYLVSELMETDLHRVIHSRQDLTSEHISYFLYQVCARLCKGGNTCAPLVTIMVFSIVVAAPIICRLFAP
jgi:mitogen-activated protein kinase 1/3